MTTTPATNFPVYVAGNTDSPRAVIVVQEAFGVTAHIRRVVDQYAELGYFAIAPHLFHRDGSPEVAYDDFPAAMGFLQNLTSDGITNDLDATIRFLNSLGYQQPNIGIVGYCMGGSVAFHAATMNIVGAAVTYYGGGVTSGRFGFEPLVDRAAALTTPWLGIYGELDKGIPADQLDALEAALAPLGTSHDIVRYAGADHGFNCEDRPSVYNEQAASAALARTTAFFDQYLTNR
jgi:carboxymethylenebutenolidase